MAPILQALLSAMRGPRRDKNKKYSEGEDEHYELIELTKSPFVKWMEATPVMDVCYYWRWTLWPIAFYAVMIPVWQWFEPQWDWVQSMYFISVSLTR